MSPEEQIKELKRQVEGLANDVAEQEGGSLDRLSSARAKKDASEAVFELLSDYLFNQVNFTSFPFSQVAQGGITSTSNFVGTSRIIDTAEGKLHEVGKNSKARMSFYISNPDQIVGYVLSPAIYDSFSSLNSFSSLSLLRSYIGLKIDQGVMSVVVKEAGRVENEYFTGKKLNGSGPTDTFVLEILYNGNTSSVYLDKELLGNFNTNFILPNTDTKVFLPLLSPAKSVDGSSVNITIENFQFLQDR